MSSGTLSEQEEKVSTALWKIANELGTGYTVSAVAPAYVTAKARRVSLL